MLRAMTILSSILLSTILTSHTLVSGQHVMQDAHIKNYKQQQQVFNVPHPSPSHDSTNTTTTTTTLPIRLYTHNIRMAALPSERERNELPWPQRLPHLSASINFHTAPAPESLICLQEVLHHQLYDLLADLNRDSSKPSSPSSPASSPAGSSSANSHDPGEPYASESSSGEWSYIGLGRTSGGTTGEHNPIFYRPSVWALENSVTRWLSRTPHEPSRSWGATLNRIVTAGVFRHRATDARVVAACTHLDHLSETVRRRQVEVLLREVGEIAGIVVDEEEEEEDEGTVDIGTNTGTSMGMSAFTSAVTGTGIVTGNKTANEIAKAKAKTKPKQKNLPILLAGDFNSPLTESAYQFITGKTSPLADVRELIDPARRYGGNVTYTSFDPDSNEMSLIDFLFVGPKQSGRWEVRTHGVLPNRFDDGVFASDHRPVVADVVLKV